MTRTIQEWQLSIRLNNETILSKEVKRGIIQGDSLSPLLFVLCMDPLSRRLNGEYPKPEIKLESEVYTCNHLLFIDDLKLFAESDDTLTKMMSETDRFFKSVGLEMNAKKSATNSSGPMLGATELSPTDGYKYLGVTENRCSIVMRQSYTDLKNTIIERTKSICNTRLSGKNSIRALNEYALSVANYYIGVVPMELVTSSQSTTKSERFS